MSLLFLVPGFGFAASVENSESPDPPASESVFSNGDFETLNEADGAPDDWNLSESATIEQEPNGNRFLRIEFAKPDDFNAVPRKIALDPAHEAFEFTFRARFSDIRPGKKQWHDGRVILDFLDAEGSRISSPSAPYFKKSSQDWVEKQLEFVVPENAAHLQITPVLFNVRSGTLDLDDFKLTPLPAAPIIARQTARAKARAADTLRRAALVKPSIPRPADEAMPPMLRVVGNEIQTADGTAVWLRGIAIPSLEWVSNGENILRSIDVAINEWQANCIRLPVREHFWRGKGPYQKDGGAGYRQLIEDAANLCAQHGAYLVIDLHRFRAPESAHAEFWSAAANRFKNHPAVLFELFNEPHDISWEVWKNGGLTQDHKTGETGVSENDEKLRSFETIGMQDLIDTVRATGARNIVLVGGLDWGYDLSGVLDGYALEDPEGNGIVYSTHVYPWKSDWAGKFLSLAEHYPIFIGEMGGEETPMPFLEPDQHEDPHTWAPDMLGLIQKHKLHFTAWSFHNKASPRLILDWDYTPTPYWGQYVKDALTGKEFELIKIR